MRYNYTKWVERHRYRSDLSARLTHLTASLLIEDQSFTAIDVLIKILQEETILGSTTETGFIVGQTPAVCFQATPLAGLAENIRHEEKEWQKEGNYRYEGVGLSFDTQYAYSKGCRPVIYEKTNIAKAMLPASEHWRIVSLDLDDKEDIVDWSHEREWRCPGDFKFERERAVVIVWGSTEYREFISKTNHSLLQEILGITVLKHAIS